MIISIPIPDNAKCLLKNGQTIDINQPFVEYSTITSISIPLSQKLQISSGDIFKYIVKFVGENIKKGEALAIKKGFFSSTKILSEYDGIIKEIDHNNGLCVIDVEKGEKKNILSYFKGEVTEINKKELHLKVKNPHEYLLKESTGNFGGKTIYLKNYSEKAITTQNCNTVCIAETITPYFQSKTEALGIDGYVSLNKLSENTSLPNALFKQIADIKKAIEQNFPYCIIDKKKSIIIFYQ